VERLSGRSFKSRWPGALAAYSAAAGLAAVAVWLAARKLGGAGLDAAITAARNDLDEAYASAVITLNDYGLADYFTAAAGKTAAALTASVSRVTENIPRAAAKIAGGAADAALGLVIAFYITKDKNRALAAIKAAAGNTLPPRFTAAASRFLSSVHGVLSGYLRGQLIDAAIMGALFCAALSLIGVPFAVPIGIFGGAANVVPYFGAAAATLVAAFSAVCSGEPARAAIAAAAMIILQQIDAAVIIPRVIGKRVDISPLATLIAITVGGGLFGLWGMAAAVPVCAVIKKMAGDFINPRRDAPENPESVCK
jgi:predicted PurR-regulated permease PerM